MTMVVLGVVAAGVAADVQHPAKIRARVRVKDVAGAVVRAPTTVIQRAHINQ